MEKRLILRGIIAGAVAGLLAFVFARILAEPVINTAINYESARDAAQDALDKAAGLPIPDAGPDIFSRTVQANIGIGVGMVFFGIAMGALFAVTYAICLGRVGALRPRNLALLVAGGGFLGVYFVPFIKYPANPPSIGHPDTIHDRGNLYLVMVACSVLFLIGAVVLGKRLKPRFGNWNATLLAGAAFVVAIGIVMALLPSLGELSANVKEFGHHATETPLPLTNAKGAIVFPGFPADTLFSFRFYSVAAQLLLWGTLALVFGPMAERLLQPKAAPATPSTPSTAPAAEVGSTV
ncbi:CbtA family protein [Streptacidiphilus cavernicola]|uniref:CbtA family protein n=1 Tax=Streptacidiphilus cavernicola TaxID=3342716 RepID=A0ABV6W032_9ACTN